MKIAMMKILEDNDNEDGNGRSDDGEDGKESISNYGRNGEEYSGIKCIECSTI